MSVNKYNAERYPDPTAYQALTSIQQEERSFRAFRPLVYICSPYAGDIRANTAATRRYCRFAVKAGYIPLAPHLLFPQFLNEANPKERQLRLFFGKVLLDKCNEIWVFGGLISPEMKAEINRSRWKNCRLRYFNEKCQEV